jgi:hypothetical protein
VFEFEVPESGRNDVQLEVGAPSDVEVEVRDESTGDLVPAQVATWWLGDGDGSATAATVKRGGSEPAFRFRAPVGRLHFHLNLFDDHYFTTERAFDLVPGLNRVRFPMRRNVGLRVSLHDGPSAVPMRMNYRLTAAKPGQPSVIVGSADTGLGSLQYYLSEPGLYEVSVAGVPGFLPSRPVAVTARLDEIVDVTIPLERER